MENTMMRSPSSIAVQAVLEGGPPTIPNATRTRIVDTFEEKIKIPHYGGYEHFERIGEIDDASPPDRITYYWTMRTEVAE
jgi:Family of unknown function (DUF5988)